MWALDPRWAGGRPRRISAEGEAFLIETATTRPGELGRPFTHWSLRKLVGTWPTTPGGSCGSAPRPAAEGLTEPDSPRAVYCHVIGADSLMCRTLGCGPGSCGYRDDAATSRALTRSLARLTGRGRSNDVAQLLGHATGRTGGVVRLVEGATQIGDEHRAR